MSMRTGLAQSSIESTIAQAIMVKDVSESRIRANVVERTVVKVERRK